MSKKKIIVIFTIIIFLIIIGLGLTDYLRVKSFEKPKFTFISKDLQKDGGSGTFIGLGYSVKIKGNFMTDLSDDTITHGVTEYEFYVIGIKVSSGIRD